MNLFRFVVLSLLLLVNLDTTHAQSLAAPAGVPNIIVVLADDFGYGDAGCYGGKIPTPAIDRLATEGMRFTDAHSGSSVCSPTRYGLLTGRYAWRTSWMKEGVLAGFDPPLIEEGQLTVPQLLREQGYATACVGKWHLGFNWEWPDATGRPPLSVKFGKRNTWDLDHYPTLDEPITGGPIDRGFDYFFGNTAPNQPPYCFIEDDRIVDLPSDAATQTYTSERRPIDLKDEDILPTLVDKAVKYVESRASLDQPFFLYFPLTSPHYPVAPSAAYKGKSGIGDMGDFLMETDGALGAVLDALDRTGQAANTLVLFTTDNGHDGGRSEELLAIGHDPDGVLRGWKGMIYEGGHRVPMVVRWPGVTPAGSTSDATICHTHLLATCADLLKTKLPEGAGPDSYSILPILRGEKTSESPFPAVVHQTVNGTLAIRRGDWKWIEPQKNGDPPALYNLRDDLPETTDLSTSKLEMVDALRAALEALRNNGS